MRDENFPVSDFNATIIRYRWKQNKAHLRACGLARI